MGKKEVSFKLMGDKIRDLRREKKISSTILAESIGVTPAYISQIERNIVEPSLPVLRNLAKALNVELLFLFEYEAPTDVLITSTGNVMEKTISQANAKYQILTPMRLYNGVKPDMSVMIVKIAGEKTDYDEMVTHDFVEFCYVLEGCIEYRTDKKNYHLSEGDSIYIKRNVPHLLYNPSRKEAKLLAVLGNIHPHLQTR
ncbi:helix-turn-helix domain-containing protein [Sporosalibacterium faouarense]|uniref:helix-turn-helix domain-containing protein n=1 Tax=Sporosalibacterium faouarense TaxID=516123 RepID=UPI00141D5856|nr:XRE family transcriptional regulator [Sporosalibacterium faouarense]MTI47162.1 helix-turn-helix domain-containing protein [Bacillota bacterium]